MLPKAASALGGEGGRKVAIDKGKKTTGKRPAVKTGEFKVAKTAPVIKAPTEDETPTVSAMKAAPPELADDAAPAAPAPKTASGKAKATTTGSFKVAKTTSGRRAAVSERTAAPPRVRTGREIWVTCRECGEEWVIDPERARGRETIACPICEHRAQGPNDDILHQIALYKGIEKKNLTAALMALLVGVFAMLLWTLLTANPARAEDPLVFYGPVAVGVISLVATLFFASKYENSRWETYF
jgi:hypothetical protein